MIAIICLLGVWLGTIASSIWFFLYNKGGTTIDGRGGGKA